MRNLIICTAQYCSSDTIEKNAMGGAYSA